VPAVRERGARSSCSASWFTTSHSYVTKSRVETEPQPSQLAAHFVDSMLAGRSINAYAVGQRQTRRKKRVRRSTAASRASTG